MCTKSQLEAIEEEMVNYYRSVYVAPFCSILPLLGAGIPFLRFR